MSTLAYCFGNVAPFYNLALVAVVIYLFIRLFQKADKKMFIKPWKLVFSAVLIYVFEEIITVLDMSGTLDIPAVTFPLLETAIISIFIYGLLLQKEKVK
ncbi:MAG TPA: hypothetical protein VFF28_07145 [Candidatus Nanoarchaeia archaeon]|nr:hypothetical protein [Candidatus Nanoarchaeia archaeon]